MIQEERFLKIVDHLKLYVTASLAELAELSETSVDTVRRDLIQLEKSGMVKRVRGGAVYHSDDLRKQAFSMRGISNKSGKVQAAKLVERYVVDGQAIALNSGTTNIEVAKFLAENYYRLTIISNDLHIIDILSQVKNFTVMVPGGMVNREEGAIFGSSCERDIASYNIDTAIITVNALSIEKGVTDFRVHEVGIIKSMIGAARKKIIVADSTKFDSVSCLNVCSLKELDVILTDDEVSQDVISRYRAEGLSMQIPAK